MSRSALRRVGARSRSLLISFFFTYACFSSWSILSAATGTAVSVDTVVVPSTRIAQDYAVTLQASGGSGTFRWTVASGTLPQGLTLDSSTGLLHGVAATGGRFTFTVKAADAVDTTNNAVRPLALTVLAEAPRQHTRRSRTDRRVRRERCQRSDRRVRFRRILSSAVESFELPTGASGRARSTVRIGRRRARTQTPGAQTASISIRSAQMAR